MPSVLQCESRRRIPIIGNRDKLENPTAGRSFCDGIPGMRRSDLHRVRARIMACVRLDPNAAGIHDDLGARKARQPGNVRMAAQDQRRIAASRALLDPVQGRGAQFAVDEVLEIAIDVAFGRCMTQEYVGRDAQYGRQEGEPIAVGGGNAVVGIPIGCSQFAGILGRHLTVVIAANGRQIERHQAIRGFARLQRTRKNIAQVDDEVDTAAIDVGQHRIERKQIAVDVGDGSNLHAIFQEYRASNLMAR
jgi:hypothetical protein